MKFFYALGVYTFCVGVHNVFQHVFSDEFAEKINELSEKIDGIKSGEKKKEEDCKGAVVAKVVKHRIGF